MFHHIDEKRLFKIEFGLNCNKADGIVISILTITVLPLSFVRAFWFDFLGSAQFYNF